MAVTLRNALQLRVVLQVVLQGGDEKAAAIIRGSRRTRRWGRMESVYACSGVAGQSAGKQSSARLVRTTWLDSLTEQWSCRIKGKNIYQGGRYKVPHNSDYHLTWTECLGMGGSRGSH